MATVDTETALGRCLRDLPSLYNNKYGPQVTRTLRKSLCTSLVRGQLGLLFGDVNTDGPSFEWRVSEVQGGQEGNEYTASARGHACGHIFKAGESSYHCKTCAADDTCVLCARCFKESDHHGHAVYVTVSPGNSGCCDCGDLEAWTRPVHCAIHSPDNSTQAASHGKAPLPAGPPQEILDSMKATIGKALDYVCDVFACSPEQLREEKSVESVTQNERLSRLNPDKYGGEEPHKDPKYCLIVWNDEKHTVDQVRDQIARATAKPKSFGLDRAVEIDRVGRSVVEHSSNLANLLQMARILEQIKLSVTIRSSRDTFREQMGEAIIEWLSDIHGCSVGSDPNILRDMICTEFFAPWKVGSPKPHADIAKSGIYDHDKEDKEWNDMMIAPRVLRIVANRRNAGIPIENELDDDDEEDGNDEDDENNDTNMEETEDAGDIWNEGPNMIEINGDGEDLLQRARVLLQNMVGRVPEAQTNDDPDLDIDMADFGDDPGEVSEATLAGYPPPPPPPVGVRSPNATRHGSMSESLSGRIESQESDNEPLQARSLTGLPSIPRTPHIKPKRPKARPAQHWLTKPNGWVNPSEWSPRENLKHRLRIDCLMLFDLRLWKTLRDSLRFLYISAVITVPEFKRLMGLRFAGLYSLLAQLYLVADREPDHSIINLSLQLLTTPSITAEIVEKANFLTHLMAIMYTFLTTREVKYPEGVSPNATLSFETGAVTNRRMFHFFIDARYILQASSVQERLRTEPHFLKQFLDLVKLHQGINPNVRAVGEHVEYETETWVGLAMITKEISRLSRLVADAFFTADLNDSLTRQQVSTAIRNVVFETMNSSLGLEWYRFSSCEMKRPLKFRNVGQLGQKAIMIPDIRVMNADLSFQHPLHNLTSWMLQSVQAMTREGVQGILATAFPDILETKDKHPDAFSDNGPFASTVTPYDWWSAMFDKPLRMYVWLVQMRAGLWVRNGMNLRHQMHAYRNPAHRDVSYQRDIYMLQAGLVLCDQGSTNIGEKFLLQIIYRFDLEHWLNGSFKAPADYDDHKYMDVVEDFFHLLVSLLTEREDLLPTSNFGKPSKRAIQRDIAHALCFKPMSYSELTGRLTERIYDHEAFDEVLSEVSTFKSPEGLNDSGTYVLKPDFIELVDPYYVFYGRNQREEADTIYRDYFAKKQGINKTEVVPEPSLLPIAGGLFEHLAGFVRTSAFASLILNALKFATTGFRGLHLDTSRVEPILHVILHLIIIGMKEDARAGVSSNELGDDFHHRIMHSDQLEKSILSHVQTILQVGDYASCHPRARLILKRAQQALPILFSQAINIEPGSDAVLDLSQGASEKEAKKQAALARQARVMAQFKEQQSSFMTNHGLDWDANMSDDEDPKAVDMTDSTTLETEKVREYPADACILCQEEANDDRLYGCFACIMPSSIQRQTPVNDPVFVQEVLDTPISLDRAADTAAQNGAQAAQHVHTLSRGFDHYDHTLQDHVVTSCGHMMHFSCFETYVAATQRRQAHQISRCHPERLEKKEFLCPLCKALGNVFLPVIWKSRKEHYPGVLGSATQSFDDWLVGDIQELKSRLESGPPAYRPPSTYVARPTPVSSVFARAMTTRPLSIFDRPGRTFVEWTGSSPAPAALSSNELHKAYQLLNASVYANCLKNDDTWSADVEAPLPLATYVRTIASTIAAVEIQHRGVQSKDSLLASIPEQTLSSLRIFCETTSSVLAVGQMRDAASLTKAEDCNGFNYLLGLEDSDQYVRYPTPIHHNTFWSLSACALRDGHEFEKHGHNLIQLALLAEVCKVIYIYRPLLMAIEASLSTGASAEQEDQEFSIFCRSLDHISDEINMTAEVSGLTAPQSVILQGIVERHALIFLRKVTILMHVRCAVDFSAVSSGLDPAESELDRLCKLLRLPGLSAMYTSFVRDSPAAEAQEAIVKRWLANSIPDVQPRRSATLDHPAIFELVQLPTTFDTLTELAVHSKCPTTGRDVTDPVVCLFCGAIFCSQASCCRLKEGGIGGAGQHLAKCGGGVGLFLNIRKCMVLFLHERHGSFAPAPYLDRHGEADPTLRRHQQLFLNRRRYDKLLRDVWLAHGIPSVISRKLEGDISNGGWETL